MNKKILLLLFLSLTLVACTQEEIEKEEPNQEEKVSEKNVFDMYDSKNIEEESIYAIASNIMFSDLESKEYETVLELYGKHIEENEVSKETEEIYNSTVEFNKLKGESLLTQNDNQEFNDNYNLKYNNLYDSLIKGIKEKDVLYKILEEKTDLTKEEISDYKNFIEKIPLEAVNSSVATYMVGINHKDMNMFEQGKGDIEFYLSQLNSNSTIEAEYIEMLNEFLNEEFVYNSISYINSEKQALDLKYSELYNKSIFSIIEEYERVDKEHISFEIYSLRTFLNDDLMWQKE